MATIEPTIAQFMTSAPATVDEDLMLSDAGERMAMDNIRHLVVVDRTGHVVGVLSSGDVVLVSSMAANARSRRRLRVRDAMSEPAFSCRPTTPLGEVALALEAHRWGCAVIREGDEIVGIFTTTDALRALRQLATGRSAAPAVHPTHLPPADPAPTRGQPLRRHRKLDLGHTGLFRTSG